MAIDELRVFGRRQPGADLHELETCLASEYARRLLGCWTAPAMNCGSWAATPSRRSLMFAKLSPTSRHVAYVRENNSVRRRSCHPPDHRPDRRLGNRHIINGTFDWVYEEELSLRDGFEWSPDGTKIAYWQIDTTGVPEFTLVNNTDGVLSRADHLRLSQGRPAELGVPRGRRSPQPAAKPAG